MTGAGTLTSATATVSEDAYTVVTADASVQSQEYWLGSDMLRASDAWAITRGKGVTVAVVDSGVQDSLPELQDQVLPGHDAGGAAATDGPMSTTRTSRRRSPWGTAPRWPR